MTFGRMAWWFLLAGFPILITILIRYANDFAQSGVTPTQIDAIWSGIYYMLVPGVCCALSVFLHTAPAVASELENRSWVYLATRPNGVFWLLLGKYLVAVLWAISAAVVGVSVSAILCNASSPFQIWSSMVKLSTLSSISYAALYLMIGAMFPRRAMVFCVAYTAVVEVFLSMIPAVVNRLTIQYRMRSLFVNWMDEEMRAQIQDDSISQYMFAQGSVIEQILWLLSLTAIFLVIAQIVAHKKEFTSAAESDV
jgi:ABC-type transport system involved in multi-copper enzyme maturation permease subunit